MKAVLCKVFGPPESLVLEEIEPFKPGKNQVVINVKACGVNFPDTLIIQDKYQFKPALPFSPGGEFAGIITSIGEEVARYKVGDRVIAFAGWGGFAQEAVVDVARLIPLPESVDFVTGASFVMTYGTSYHALKDRAKLKEGETLLVLGAAGGVGLAAVELGKMMGARVIAAASTEAKLEICRQYGADEVINYTTTSLKDKLKELTGGKGVDVVYDPVGGEYTEIALRNTGWEGRYLVVGFAAGDIPRIPLNLTLLKGCSVMGVFWGAFAEKEARKNQQNLQELLHWYMQGKLKPHISATYHLHEAATALNDMLQRKVMGKVVMITDS